MTIDELAAKGIATITRPNLGGANSRLTIFIADNGGIGPWVTVEDHATDAGILEPPKVFIGELPDDDKYTEFIKPEA